MKYDVLLENDPAAALMRIAAIQDSPTSYNEIGLWQTFISQRLIDGYSSFLEDLESTAS